MVKEIDRNSTDSFDKVLVCITAQSNSKRLINHGAEIADKLNGELHILHVQKGNNIFNNSETPMLLQELFQYGSQKGGMVHAYCDDNIPESIGYFIKKEKITKLVLGEPPTDTKFEKKINPNEFTQIIKKISNSVEIITVPREYESSISHYKVV